jgi:hypothetical protein
MTLIPPPFLLRVAYPCQYVKNMPCTDLDVLFELADDSRVDHFAEGKHFAEVRLGWNELGLGLQVKVRGKAEAPQGDVARPRDSDGVTFWVDTRDARTSHRASRYCHQFHFLAAGGGPEHDEPTFVQTRMNRALQDAPIAMAGSVLIRRALAKQGYRLDIFVPASCLMGFDPEQNPRLGFYYCVRDQELGEQVLGVGPEFPFWEDPSLWSVVLLTGK